MGNGWVTSFTLSMRSWALLWYNTILQSFSRLTVFRNLAAGQQEDVGSAWTGAGPTSPYMDPMGLTLKSCCRCFDDVIELCREAVQFHNDFGISTLWENTTQTNQLGVTCNEPNIDTSLTNLTAMFIISFFWLVVGGLKPFEKYYCSQFGSFPQVP